MSQPLWNLPDHLPTPSWTYLTLTAVNCFTSTFLIRVKTWMAFVSSVPSTMPGAQLMLNKWLDKELPCVLSFHAEKAQLSRAYHFPSPELRTQTSPGARKLSQLLIPLTIMCISYSSVGNLGKAHSNSKEVGRNGPIKWLSDQQSCRNMVLEAFSDKSFCAYSSVSDRKLFFYKMFTFIK